MRTAQEVAVSIHTFQNKEEKTVAQFHIQKCVSKETRNSDEMTEEQRRTA